MNPEHNGHAPFALSADQPVRHAYAFEQNGRGFKTFCGRWVPDRELAQRPSDMNCPVCQAESDACDAMEI
jgi:hypothetical protein